MTKRYRYKRTLYKIGDTVYKRVGENKLVCDKDKDGFQISLTFLADHENHIKAIESFNDIFIKTLFQRKSR